MDIPLPGQSAHALGGAACPRLSERVMTRKGVSVSRIQACQVALNPICTYALKVVESLCILAPLEVLRLAELRVRSGVPECLACTCAASPPGDEQMSALVASSHAAVAMAWASSTVTPTMCSHCSVGVPVVSSLPPPLTQRTPSCAVKKG